ncbi:spore coat protein [Clostridiaceae bacterium OttesenSCG-928-D20]|nr:spore coat protein [Clostridiaceae bacterium OttesenSCG-928-D20]
MKNPEKCANILGEKEILQDCLLCQKQLTDSYNMFAGECQNIQLRDAFLDILKEEHCIQSSVFTDMQNNGWYQVPAAEQTKIDQARQKFSNQTV